MSDKTNIVAFPAKPAEMPMIDVIEKLAPPRSLVDSLMAERGIDPHDAQRSAERQLLYDARTLEAGFGRGRTVIRLRALVDAQVQHAAELCCAYRETGELLMKLEFDATRALSLHPWAQMELHQVRALLRGRAIAARAAADAALGAVSALSIYVGAGLLQLPLAEVEPRQLSLFGWSGG